MLARLLSATLHGLSARVVDVEVDLSRGLPAWNMVGLPDAAVRESRERVQAALRNAGFEFPLGRITVNLAPADLRKEGNHFDLPVAIALLVASGQIPSFRKAVFLLGELALDGKINAIRGAIPLLLFAKEQGLEEVIVPEGNRMEAAVIPGIRAYAARNLRAVVGHLIGSSQLPSIECVEWDEEKPTQVPDLAEVRGQYQARRALEIAAAGGHHLLDDWPTGGGKKHARPLFAGHLASTKRAGAYRSQQDLFGCWRRQ